MRLVYDERFADSSYADDNAALPGRMEAAMSRLRLGPWEILAPEPATLPQLLLAHDEAYIEAVAREAKRFAAARLAAGAAILAGRSAMAGEPSLLLRTAARTSRLPRRSLGLLRLQ